METLRRYRRHKKVEHPIYTVSEAAALGLAAVPWRDAIGESWAITDDGYVALCLARNEYTSKRGRATYLRFTIGGVWFSKTAQLLWLARKISKCHGSGTKTWMELEMRRTRFKELVKAYALQRVNGQVDWEVLGRIYRRNDPKRVESAQRILRRPEAQTMIDENMKDLLVKKGITREWALEILPEALRIAKENSDANAMLKVFVIAQPILNLQASENSAGNRVEDFTPYEQIVEAEDTARRASAAIAVASEVLPPEAPDVPRE